QGDIDSGQVAIHLGQELGEVEPVGTGGLGGGEGGVRPVGGRVRELCVLAAGVGAEAVVLVVGQEPRQVAELGLGAGGHRAAAASAGAEARARRLDGKARRV